MKPKRIPGLCTGCGTCAEYCRECGISIRNEVSVLDPERCVQRGVCIQSRPFHLLKSEHSHHLVTAGGRRGRHPKIRRVLLALEDEDTVVGAVDRIVKWVYRGAWSGRLLAEQLDDLNFEAFRAELTRVGLGQGQGKEKPQQ